jgi:hypothetical protein
VSGEHHDPQFWPGPEGALSAQSSFSPERLSLARLVVPWFVDVAPALVGVVSTIVFGLGVVVAVAFLGVVVAWLEAAPISRLVAVPLVVGVVGERLLALGLRWRRSLPRGTSRRARSTRGR